MINNKPKYKTIYLHRFILNAHEKDIIDHNNHDTLDNRKENLFIVTVKQNILNRKGANKNNSTGVRNVTYDKYYEKYKVQLVIDGKNRIIDYFNSLQDAKECAEKLRKKYYK